MRKGPRNFQFLFEGTGLTRWGGLVFFRQFCESFNLRYFLQHCVRWPSYSYRHYHPAETFLIHVFAIVAGIGRIESYGNTSLGLDLRSGDILSGHNAWPFLQTMLHKLPVTVASSRTRCRLDAGFYDRAIIERLDDINVGYAIVAKMTAPLADVIGSLPRIRSQMGSRRILLHSDSMGLLPSFCGNPRTQKTRSPTSPAEPFYLARPYVSPGSSD